MATAVNCLVMEPMRNLGFWGIGDLPFGLGESEGFSVEDLAIFGDQHAADESAGIYVGLDLSFKGGWLREGESR